MPPSCRGICSGLPRLGPGKFPVVLVKARVVCKNVFHPPLSHAHSGLCIAHACTCSRSHRHVWQTQTRVGPSMHASTPQNRHEILKTRIDLKITRQWGYTHEQNENSCCHGIYIRGGSSKVKAETIYSLSNECEGQNREEVKTC